MQQPPAAAHDPARRERPQRPRELQDPLNRWLYHPLAWQLARVLAHTPLTPNMVSVIGGTFVVGAAWAYAQPWYPAAPLLGVALHMTWHVVDGADGDLARLTGRASPIGEMVDGICDYLSHIVLYLVLATILTAQIGAGPAWAWTLIAGGAHIVQSNHVEVQRRQYQFWIYGTPWLRTSMAAGSGPKRGGLGGLAAAYLALAAGMTPHAARIDAAAEDAAGDPVRLANLRAAIRAETAPLLPLTMLLGPNPRAPVLGLAMLAGSPLWYFVYQAIALNVLLVLSVVSHNRAAKRIAAKL